MNYRFCLTAQRVNQADGDLILTMMEGLHCRRKVAGCIPHDIGDPGKALMGEIILSFCFNYVLLLVVYLTYSGFSLKTSSQQN